MNYLIGREHSHNKRASVAQTFLLGLLLLQYRWKTCLKQMFWKSLRTAGNKFAIYLIVKFLETAPSLRYLLISQMAFLHLLQNVVYFSSWSSFWDSFYWRDHDIVSSSLLSGVRWHIPWPLGVSVSLPQKFRTYIVINTF